MTRETITTAEIRELMNLSSDSLSKLRNSPRSTMPAPVNDRYRFLVYDRKAIEKWIGEREAKKSEVVTWQGLDNKLAARFLRRKMIMRPIY